MSGPAAAEAYDHHVGRYGSQLAAGLIDAAGVRGGQRVLDVGCGPGRLTAALARLVGAENVAAVDPCEPFVATCRARVPLADVRVGVGERLPFPDAGFDVVPAQLVVQLMDDRAAASGTRAPASRRSTARAERRWRRTRIAGSGRRREASLSPHMPGGRAEQPTAGGNNGHG